MNYKDLLKKTDNVQYITNWCKYCKKGLTQAQFIKIGNNICDYCNKNHAKDTAKMLFGEYLKKYH